MRRSANLPVNPTLEGDANVFYHHCLSLMPEKVDAIAAMLGARLQSAEGRRFLLCGCWRLLQRLNFYGFALYAVVLILAFVLMKYLGERNMFFAFCVFWPPSVWFLPGMMFVMTSACLLDWKTLAGVVLVSIGMIIIPLDWKFPKKVSIAEKVSSGKISLTVLTNNRGQDKGEYGESLKPFMNAMRPDIMAFQESPGMANRYKLDPGYSDFPHVAEVGEFVLLSKYPIISSESVPSRPPDAGAEGWWPVIAARFRIQLGEQAMVIYNVHAPSPRGTLNYYMRGAFLYGILGLPGTPWAQRRREGERGWLQRIAQMNLLLDHAASEKEPTLLLGDFNMPGCGYLHSVVAGQFSDSHEEAGSGFGFSFPGITRNPLSLGGPWMRIDYIFSDRAHWRCAWSQAEPSRKSQHRAVVARLVFDGIE